MWSRFSFVVGASGYRAAGYTSKQSSQFSMESYAILMGCYRFVSRSQRDLSIKPRVANNELSWARIGLGHNPETDLCKPF
jgi:hypothetical protein